MKFLLTLIMCSGLAGECRVADGYPIPKPNYATCLLDGLVESHTFISNNFSHEQIETLQLIPKYTCTEITTL